MKTVINHKTILGVKVDQISKEKTLERIISIIEKSKKEKPFHIVTAYSEFFVTATKDPVFRKILNNADLVLPDGVGPLAAINYYQRVSNADSLVTKLFKGGITGLSVLTGRVGETVSGVWLASELFEMAANRGWKIFLLGGFGDVSYRLEKKLLNNYPNLKIQSDPGDQNLTIDSSQGIEKINSFKPDVLLVAYGPVKQEKWIASHKNELEAKVAIGVGGTFDELTGKVAPVPHIWEKMGLKWLWRLVQEPQRFKRIFNAFPTFPLMVFKDIV